MADNVIELNQHMSMTPEQVLIKASRYGFTDLMVIGHTEDCITIVSSDSSTMSDQDRLWLLSKAAQAVLDSS